MTDAGGSHILVLSDMTPETVELLLDWMYDTFTGCLTMSQAVDLFKAGHKFDISELQQHCERILKSLVSHQTCVQLAKLATECYSKILIEVILLQSAFCREHVNISMFTVHMAVQLLFRFGGGVSLCLSAYICLSKVDEFVAAALCYIWPYTVS